MGFDVLATMLVGLIILFMAGAKSFPCPSTTVDLNVTSTGDVDNLTDLLNCTGQGVFNVTWHSSLTIARTIEFSNTKDVTVTGSGFRTISGGLRDDNDDVNDIVDPSEGLGLFSVSNGSTLRLRGLKLARGYAENGGAVELLYSSSLFVFDCTFANNSASNGGAIYASNSTVFIEGSTSFESNLALFGGAIYAYDSDVHVNGTTAFSLNSAKGEVTSSAFYYSYSNPSLGYSGGDEASSPVVSSYSDTAPGYSGGDVPSSSIYSSYSDTVPGYSADDLPSGWLYIPSSDTASGYSGGDAASSSVYSSYSSRAPYSSGGDVASSSSFSSYSNRIIYYSGGAIFATNGSEVHIDGESSFSDNYAGYRGGAIFAKLSVITINGTATFSTNSALDEGGALNVYSSKLCIYSSTEYLDNSADFGGALHSRFSEVYMEGDAYFANNEAGNYGGAVYSTDSKINMAGTTAFVNHSSGSFGGTLFAGDSEIYTEGTTSLINSWTLLGGGAMHVTSSEIYVRGSTEFTNNTVGDGEGGAIRADESDVVITGYAVFANNTVSGDGGAITGVSSNFSITGDLPRNEGASYANSGVDFALKQRVLFVQNYAGGLGGAMFIEDAGRLQVGCATFTSNEATLGGAGYIVAVADEETEFTDCVFEENRAEDGGAMYFYTGPGVDNFATSVFRNNFASTSGGAIFHTGSMRVFNTTFVGNEAGVEGPGVMSVGLMETLSNVSFLENEFICRAGEYGYIIKEEADTCSRCLDEVCSRCSTGGDGVRTVKHVRTDGFPLCSEPPPGATAPKRGTTVATLILGRGYYRTSNESHVVRKCYQEEACVGGTDGENYCAPGYKGPYCAVCAERFAPGLGYSCRKCSGDVKRSAVGLSIAVGLASLLLAALLFAHLSSAVHDAAWGDMLVAQSDWRKKCWSCQIDFVKMLPLTAIKIVATVWQIVSQLDAIAGNVYPPVYRIFVSKLGPINLDLDFILSYSCIFDNDFYDHLLVATLSPFVVLALIAGSYVVGKKRNKSYQAAQLAVLHKHQAVVLYIAFFVYSPVSYKIFQTFACDDLDDGSSYLRADYSLSCLTSRHAWYEVYAVIMVCVYPIGIAVLFSWLLGRHRHDLVKTDREAMVHLKPFHGLWAPYKPSRYFYEVMECGRRIVLTGVAALWLEKGAAQIAVILLFAVVFVFISEAIGPFRKAADMNLYRWGNGIIVASMYAAFLVKIDVGYDTNHALLTFSGVLIAANLFMVVTVLLQTAFLVREWRRVRNAVRMIDAPVRRPKSVCVGNEEKC